MCRIEEKNNLRPINFPFNLRTQAHDLLTNHSAMIKFGTQHSQPITT